MKLNTKFKVHFIRFFIISFKRNILQLLYKTSKYFIKLIGTVMFWTHFIPFSKILVISEVSRSRYIYIIIKFKTIIF